MGKGVVLITGSNGEIGHSLIERIAEKGHYDVVSLDLTPAPESLRQRCKASYTGNIMDRYLMDQIAAHHEIEAVFHLAALLSTRGERDPELAHQVNVEGTLNLLRVAQQQSARLGKAVRFMFPSSIAAFGLPDTDTKKQVGKCKEDEWNVPVTMYGCNKLYCEHLGRYFTRHHRQLGALASVSRLDFRSLRFPGLISAETVPTGGTSDFGPEMLHAAAKGEPYTCFVGPEAKIPFMAMPDAVDALTGLLDADPEKLTRVVYNVGAFSLSAAEIATKVRAAFPRSDVTYSPDPVRAKIVDSWPEDVDDSAARQDWGWAPKYDATRAFDEYLVPSIRKRYSA
jgi:threonine 3-dehydrogenase